MLFILKSLPIRIFRGLIAAIFGAYAGMGVLFVTMQVTGLDFGLDNLRPGGLLGGVAGFLLGLVLTPHLPNTTTTESNSAKTFKAAVYMGGAAISLFAIVMAFLQGRVHLPEIGRSGDGLDTGRGVTWSDHPIIFLIYLVIWVAVAVGCFRLAKALRNERNTRD
jgi:hypothetical protein